MTPPATAWPAAAAQQRLRTASQRLRLAATYSSRGALHPPRLASTRPLGAPAPLRYGRRMPDDVQKLRETLATLHTEVDAAEARDPEVRVMLASALQLLAAKLLAHESGDPLPPGPEPADLAEAAQQFEVEHPTVAATLRSVVESLSRMGI